VDIEKARQAQQLNAAGNEATEAAPPTLKDGSGEYTAPIFDNRLTYAKWEPDSDVGRPMPEPKIIVAHYTVSQTGPGVVATFGARDSLSCHLTNFPDGTCVQMVPFNRTAAHAGKSSWQGRSSCNGFSVGIEMVNPGPVFLRDSKYFDVNGREWTGDVLESHHQNPNCSWRRAPPPSRRRWRRARPRMPSRGPEGSGWQQMEVASRGGPGATPMPDAKMRNSLVAQPDDATTWLG
jgi:hypothetical protein